MGLRYRPASFFFFFHLPPDCTLSPYTFFLQLNIRMNKLNTEIFQFLHSFLCILTIFAGLDIQDIAADSVSSLCVGQHLNTVVGELLQPSQLHLLAGRGDILHLSPF